jgi:hypothetical protein
LISFLYLLVPKTGIKIADYKMSLDIKIKTVSKDQIEFQDCCTAIEIFSNSLPNDMKRIKNYRSDLKIKESIAVSIYEKDSKIIGFSSVLHRDIFGNGVRILNRLVKNFDNRFPNGKGKLTPETQIMLDQQISIAKQYNFDYVFISRESNRPVSSLKHYLKELPQWQCPTEKFRVCGGGQQCEQYVAWLPLKENITLSLNIVGTKLDVC